MRIWAEPRCGRTHRRPPPPSPRAHEALDCRHAASRGGNRKATVVAEYAGRYAESRHGSGDPTGGERTDRDARLRPPVGTTDIRHRDRAARVVVARRRPQLDSTTIAVIEYNLKVIDDAIRQCKVALRKDPGGQFLMESLNDALDTKVQLLRTAATLPSKA